ncbi:amino acid ABC transporter permease [Breznakia pachnodae]|uniref:Polar amino acid transport system permease protein n=1 Tax=Breznakia pachnodae TaxID=265178 RepID=A0ABU0E1N7_9FIRM|nr:amino acid ABC transporter permease [Breznakia pachnodae]MDQ0360455.1 polar amino acid transport system permease protein [Breznakia pachnodae]
MEALGLEVLLRGNNMERLLLGLWTTIEIAGISLFLSIPIGIFIGIMMTSQYRFIQKLMKIYIEFIRMMPQIVMLIVVFFGFSKHLGIQLSGETASILVFSAWGSAELGDLVRGALVSLPKHHHETAISLGMNKMQILIYISLPLIVRQIIPQLMNLITRMIKTTSLIILVGVVEVSKTAQQIIEANRYEYPNLALTLYSIIFLLYFLICFPISFGSKKLEERWKY